MCEPRRRAFSTTSSVLRKRESSGDRKRRSRSWSRLASMSSPPKVADRRLLPSRAARLSIVALIVSARSRSEEHTSELQSLMRISYAVFCLKKKTQQLNKKTISIYKTLTKKHSRKHRRECIHNCPTL